MGRCGDADEARRAGRAEYHDASTCAECARPEYHDASTCAECARGFGTARSAQGHGMLCRVQVDVRTTAAQLWFVACLSVLRWFPVTAERVGRWGAFKLARYRVAGGPWRKFRELPRATVVRR